MIIVTAGKAFNDIDAFGCAVAYAELLRLEGKTAQAVFLGPLNHSVTSLAFEQGGEYLTAYDLQPNDRLVYVDLSGPDHFAFPDAPLNQIDEIYDHHYGFEDRWRGILGDRAHIERVGAAATLIWEEFVKRGFAVRISPASANLLALAILQNTLNFTSTETTERDLAAFAQLTPHLSLRAGWQTRYFTECATALEAHFNDSLRNDTKIFPNFAASRTLVFSQLEITEDPVAFLERHRVDIEKFWGEYPQAQTLLNIADISSKTSLLFSLDSVWLQESVAPLFSHAMQSTPDTILIPIHQRKQILKFFT